MIKEEFRKWLVKEGYKRKVAGNYVSGIKHLSQDLGEDIFQIKGLERVGKISRRYGLDGPKKDVGDWVHGTARASIIQYEKFVEERFG
ncbi:MAG: hypothetical protein OXF42_05860 [Candidatus Dadabacteria bacterium]|nr:hypothetical protein [Candidatus Dadabacteria bacterium]